MTGLRNRPGAPTRRPEVWTPELLAKVEWRRRAADEPFRGVSTSDGVREGIFGLEGADTSAPREAVHAYLAALTESQRAEAVFAIDDVSWRHWNNGARYFLRHGICLEELAEPVRDKAMAVLATSLSAYGYQQVVDFMHLNLTIGELRGEENLLNEWLYWFSVYGDPGSGAWGWQLDGHHVNVNCVFVGDRMTLTPTFLGAEPVVAEAGKYAGTTAFRREEAVGSELFATFTAAQRQRAVITDQLPPELFVGAFRDNFELDYAGLPFDRLTTAQRILADELIGLYVGRAHPAQARLRTDEVRAHEAETYFAWAGDPGGVFYYRVHSPVILIEFEHQAGVMFDNDHPTRRHIHTVVRTPNGGDYGVDLLRRHHERFHPREQHS
jgi:hypothetical protein